MIQTRKTNRTVDDVASERDRGYARIINHGNDNPVMVAWNLNSEASRDKVALLKIGNKEALVNADELMRFLRWA